MNFQTLSHSIKIFAVLLFLNIGSSFAQMKTVELKGNATKAELLEIVSQEIQDAKKPLVYFTASWCGPCKRYKKSLKKRLMRKVMAETTLIIIDVDANNDIALEYGVRVIPTFIKLTPTGKAIAKIDGGEWDEDTAKNIAPVMDALINTTKYDTK